MAKVSLRIYNREIERLIEQGRLDEAIAHCRHILKTFPKHLETYRLLGKAYLEARRYEEAADILSRVLMAAPDDFVAHVGLSIIRDEENRLDEAIWHMERAFEVQPSNAAIQSELQRLYGRRDGVEPPKIRMTRGALAHMYVQGEYYSQAISEIRGLLAEDSQRADMQVLLALSYFRSGQRSDASDLCNQLIERYPYCFDANRIMVDLLPANADLPESTQVYRMRVGELDPYANFVKGSVFQSDEVPDAAVSLERLEYTGEEGTEPGWDASLGIGFDSAALASASTDEPPDWLKAGGFEEEAPQPAPPTEEALPDFLRAAGWTRSSAAEEPPSVSFEEPQDDLAPADLPDWLKSQEPHSPAAESATTPIPDLSQPAETPDWLRDLGGMQTFETSETAQEEISTDVPDWVSGLGELKPSHEETAQPADLPDWLKTAQPPSEPPASAVESLGASAQEQEDGIAWLESLAAKHGAKPEELVTDPKKRSEAPPDWVQRAQSIGEPAAEPAQPTEWIANAQNVGEQFFADFEKTSEADQTGMWLRNLEEKAAQEEAAEEPPLERGEIPEWLRGVSQPADAAAPSQSADRDLTEWLSGLDEEPGLDFDAEFLRAAARPPFPSPPETPAGKTPSRPDWLSEESESERFASAPTDEPVSSAPESPVTLTTDLPEWLQGVDESAGEAAPAVEGGDIPPWLHRDQWESEVETAPQQPTPTSPADWHPLEEGPTPPPSRGVRRPAPHAIMEGPPKAAKKTAARKQKGEGQSDANILNQAKAELDRGDLPAALEHFERLIKKGKYLEEIIAELTDSLYRYPVEVGIWQTLGDAYMRANRLKEALDAYNKAEELIR